MIIISTPKGPQANSFPPKLKLSGLRGLANLGAKSQPGFIRAIGTSGICSPGNARLITVVLRQVGGGGAGARPGHVLGGGVNDKAGYAASASTVSTSNHTNKTPNHTIHSSSCSCHLLRKACLLLWVLCVLLRIPAPVPNTALSPKGVAFLMLMLMSRTETTATTTYLYDLLVPGPDLSTFYALFYLYFTT